MKKGMQTVFVRFDTEIQVELPNCGECNGGEPCPMCREEAIRVAVSIIRGSWAVNSDYVDRGPDDDNWVDVYSECSEDDVIEVRVE